MIERFYEYTCNGCGEEESLLTPDLTVADVRQKMRSYGWRSFPGGLDYCRICVERGIPAKGIKDFSA